MYKLVVQLQQCDTYGHEYGEIIHEMMSPEFNSIQEAFEYWPSGKKMFELYLKLDKIVKEDIARITGKSH